MPNLSQLEVGSSDVELQLDNGDRLNIQSVVRKVNGRRLVCRALWQDKPVFAKIFFGKQAEKYARRDEQGVNLLTRAQIKTPELMLASGISSEQVRVLAYAAIEGADNAEAVWQVLPILSAQRKELALKLVAVIAGHHKAGLVQDDLYLKNFLLDRDHIWTLDGDAVRQSGWFKSHDYLSNLALLLSKLDVLELSAWMFDLCAAYVQARGGDLHVDLSALRRHADAIRYRVVAKYADSKVFRNCTDVKVQRDCTRFVAVSRKYDTQALDTVLQAPDDGLSDISQRLKSGNTCTVGKFLVAEQAMVIKRYNIKSFWHGLGRAWRASRAADSWSAAHRLLMLGIATPAPVALLEKRWGCLRRQAYLFCAWVDGPDVAEFFASTEISQTEKQGVANGLAQMFCKLAMLKLVHGDFKHSNVKIVGQQPMLIDLDAMQQYRCERTFVKQHRRDIARFMANWREQPEVAQMLETAFNEAYSNAGLAGFLKGFK